MKTSKNISSNLIRGLAVLTITSLLSVPTIVSAQQPVKGAQKLLQLHVVKAVASTEAIQGSDMVVMPCPQCKNSWVTQGQAPAKTGVKPETKAIARHECPGCEHKYVSQGHGKAKTEKLVHVCKQCGSEDAFCCTIKKGAGPTPGMKKK